MERILALDDRDVLDVGCGDGRFVRELAARGARAIGMEISEGQLGDARARTARAGSVTYVIGRGEALPLQDASVDAVTFMRSLHHVPIDVMDAALLEAARVLRPDGVVYVAEPLPEGDYFELVRIVDDETDVRAAAQAAIARAGARAGTGRHERHEYEVGVVTDLDRLRARIVGVDPARAGVFDARRDALRDALGRLGEPREDGRWFTQPMRVDVLRTAS